MLQETNETASRCLKAFKEKAQCACHMNENTPAVFAGAVQRMMSYGYIQRLSGVFTNMIASRWWSNPCSAHPDFKLNSFLLFHKQRETLSAAAAYLQASVFLPLFCYFALLACKHTDCAKNPPLPISTGNRHTSKLFTQLQVFYILISSFWGFGGGSLNMWSSVLLGCSFRHLQTSSIHA